jgi:hypothetical protein
MLWGFLEIVISLSQSIARPVNQNHPAALRLDALRDGAAKIANRPGDDHDPVL